MYFRVFFFNSTELIIQFSSWVFGKELSRQTDTYTQSSISVKLMKSEQILICTKVTFQIIILCFNYVRCSNWAKQDAE